MTDIEWQPVLVLAVFVILGLGTIGVIRRMIKERDRRDPKDGSKWW